MITALFAVIMATWSVVTPIYHAADEPNHADAVMRLEEGRGWTSARTAKVTPEGVGAIVASPFGRPDRRLSLNLAPISRTLAVPRDERPTWQDLKAPPGTADTLIQQTPQHPPGYYWYEAVILRLGGAAGWRWDITVSTMRLLSALLVMWIPLLAWATAWRVTGNRLAGITAAIFPLAVPELTHIGGTVSNDTLVTLSGGATLLGLACAMRGDRSKGTALWTGLWMTVCLWSKAFGLVLLPVVFLVYVTPWIRTRWAARAGPNPPRGLLSWLPNRQHTVLLSLSFGAGILLGLWFYIFNELKWGSLAPGPPNFPPGRYLGHDFALFAKYPTQAMLQRWWGDLGWFEVLQPWRLVLVATIISGLLALWGILRWQGRRITLIVLMWPTALSYLIVVAGVTSYYLSKHYIRGISGRYVYVGFVAAAVLVGAGCAALPRKIARWSPLALLLAAVGMQLETAHLAINRWWRPTGGTLRQAWDTFSSWSTWPVGVLFAGIALLALLTAATFVVLARLCVLDPTSPSSEARSDETARSVPSPQLSEPRRAVTVEDARAATPAAPAGQHPARD